MEPRGRQKAEYEITLCATNNSCGSEANVQKTAIRRIEKIEIRLLLPRGILKEQESALRKPNEETDLKRDETVQVTETSITTNPNYGY